MADRPIIFSAPMIQALLDGRKTMTRRLAWRVSINEGGVVYDAGGGQMDYVEPHEVRRPSPWQRVQPGDRLWVRENWLQFDADHVIRGQRLAFGADTPPGSDSDRARKDYGYKWRPSIHMPRWASRMTLIVTATKIERLQDIGYVDAHREGVEDMNALGTGAPRWRDYEGTGANAWFLDSRQSFAALWRTLHGPESWDANPEVVALTFRVARANIDSAEARAA